MINLEMKQLTRGEYMQGIQLQIQGISPILEHAYELLLLPEAMKWVGDANFELAALSESEEGEIVLRRYLNLRLRVPANAKDSLRTAVKKAASDLKSWLESVSVGYSEVRYDDDGLLARLPAAGYSFIGKAARRASGGYTATLMPLEADYSLNLPSIEAMLYKYPYSGVVLQLSPDRWRKNELSALERYASGEGIEEDVLRDTINGGIACFTCATWGNGTRAIADAIIGAYALSFAVKAVSTNGGKLVEMLACDPWCMHSKINASSRYAGVLTIKELTKAFRCVPTQIGHEKGEYPSAPAEEEAVLKLIHDAVEKMASTVQETANQTIKEAKEFMITTENKLNEKLNHSEQRTTEQLNQLQQVMQDHSEQISHVGASLDVLRSEQETLRQRLEQQVQLTEGQMVELLDMLNSMTNERDELKKEIVLQLTRGPEQPLSSAACSMLGIASEQVLEVEGMTENQMKILRIAMACIEGKEIMQHEIPKCTDNAYYHPYVALFGFLYEQLVRTFYHDKIYVPYCNKYCNGIIVDPTESKSDTDLVNYECGPIKQSSIVPADLMYVIDAWKWEHVLPRFENGICIDGKKYGAPYWRVILKMMQQVRVIRNKIHDTDMSVNEAYIMINMMARNNRTLNRGYPCLIRWLVALNKATTDF